jgi:hypothetical protein
MKALAHGNRQAFAVRPARCRACKHRVAACPEEAPTLARSPAFAFGS